MTGLLTRVGILDRVLRGGARAGLPTPFTASVWVGGGDGVTLQWHDIRQMRLWADHLGLTIEVVADTPEVQHHRASGLSGDADTVIRLVSYTTTPEVSP